MARTIEKTKQEKSIIVEELQERLILNNALSSKPFISYLKTTQIGSFARYDCTFISATTKIVADAKIRKLPYTYEYVMDKGIFIEVSKYDNMLKLAEKMQSIPYYINYVPLNENEGYLMLINLMEIQFLKRNIEIYIGRTGDYQKRHVIDLNNTPKELIKIQYKKLMDDNKDFLNSLYSIYANNNYEMQNLLNIL
ncbi:hypothetical protein UFOVP648_3 [uncultured Caudovirales phage]|uniref:Uncharacterized protein n=1 Tax=uncultured Caudovirales phage TaxID=2100421 RepID=A0A6J5N4E2_9CAUD|nr:hypothetical protein UFOVP648_3 [uncultured Caudovirales phage]